MPRTSATRADAVVRALSLSAIRSGRGFASDGEAVGLVSRRRMRFSAPFRPANTPCFVAAVARVARIVPMP